MTTRWGMQPAMSRLHRRTGVIAAVLAFGVGAWSTVTHDRVGAFDDSMPVIARWLRESTLSLPLVLISVLLGLAIQRRIAQRGASGHLIDAAALAVPVATALALAMPLRNALGSSPTTAHSSLAAAMVVEF